MNTERELMDHELGTVSGGNVALDTIKQINNAIPVGASSGPPEVWVGCAWVPQWW